MLADRAAAKEPTQIMATAANPPITMKCLIMAVFLLVKFAAFVP